MEFDHWDIQNRQHRSLCTIIVDSCTVKSGKAQAAAGILIATIDINKPGNQSSYEK